MSIFKGPAEPVLHHGRGRGSLDDTNLGRFITPLRGVAGQQPTIVITHQKKTMEIADALYGVTMRGGGITTVVSQRLRDVATASA